VVVYCAAGEWRRVTTSGGTRCQCGCTLTDAAGHIVVSARQQCRSAVRRWTIHVDARQLITLTVQYFTLSRDGASSLRLYDSSTATPVLLLQLPDQRRDATTSVVTSGARMLIEYTYTPADHDVITDHDVSVRRSADGFVASYVAVSQLTGALSHCSRTFTAKHI